MPVPWLAALAAAEDPSADAQGAAAAAGLTRCSPSAGALLRWLAGAGPARTAVEVGDSGGVNGLWLLAGMAARGTLTSIEASGAGHDLARHAYTAAGAGDRVRAVLGTGTTVLPRLADAAYDMAVLATEHAAWPHLLVHARRVLRPGGVLVALGADVGEAADGGSTADAVREAVTVLHDDPAWSLAIVDAGDGIVLARLEQPTAGSA